MRRVVFTVRFALALFVALMCARAVAVVYQAASLPAMGCRVLVYDWDGQERSWEWLRDKWGNVQVSCPDDSWDVLMLREDLSGSTTTVVALFDEDGYPLVGVPVVNSWPDGEIVDDTDGEGRAYFSWGKGAYYEPPDGGPYTICVGETCVTGLGWLWMSNHSHLNPFFWGEGPPPTATPTPTPEYRVFLPVVMGGE